MIESRMSNLCSSKYIFDNNNGIYEAAFKKASYKDITINYQDQNANLVKAKRKDRIRNVISFSPLYSSVVETKS